MIPLLLKAYFGMPNNVGTLVWGGGPKLQKFNSMGVNIFEKIIIPLILLLFLFFNGRSLKNWGRPGLKN